VQQPAAAIPNSISYFHLYQQLVINDK